MNSRIRFDTFSETTYVVGSAVDITLVVGDHFIGKLAKAFGTRHVRGQSFPGIQKETADKVDVLGVPVHALDRHALTELLQELPEGKTRGWLSYVNVHAVNLANELPWFRDFLRESLITYCDGEGVRLGSKIIGKPLPERIVLTDWIYDVCATAQEQKWKLYLLGSTDIVLEKTVRTLQTRYPDLRFAGFHNGFFKPQENGSIVSTINRSRPDILIVGMGMPRQEKWILENIRNLKVHLIMNAGSCFDYVSGEKRRCPAWMGRLGLEWLFRLMLEPRRLWKRYLIGNPLFLMRVIRARLTARGRQDS
ncbi:MAG: WecB/TagA/CpsF family glycosyltransferase [Bacteroidota bacterium]